MRRRELLGLAALGGIAGCANVGPPGQSRSPVVILGAGLAGLSAAHELRQQGREVLVLEARSRPGGRVLTLREPFSDGQHAEAGALFVPANHNLTLKFARLFRLPLQPAMPLFSAQLYYARGRQIDPVNGIEPWPFALTDEERSLGRAGLWQQFVEAGLRENPVVDYFE